MEKLFRKSDRKLQCLLCPHFCKIEEGKTGICGIRKNSGTRIDLLTYGIISGCSLDPVEKKPLYHFFPGKKILSIGSYGCNMKCDFCQNYHISQKVPQSISESTMPEEIAADSLIAVNNIGIAFTYNEPVIWFEYVIDTAIAVKDKGLYTVLVTNGYINPDPLSEILKLTDAFNVDLKAFNNDFYRRLAGATLEPVKNTLKAIIMAGKHLEITTLLVTGQNDKISEMEEQVKWISGELGNDVPFHLSRYFPMYLRNDPATPHNTIMEHYEIARKHLNFVYIGNTLSETGQNTSCPSCGKVITRRSGYHINNTGTLNGTCSDCGKEIYKYFTSFS